MDFSSVGLQAQATPGGRTPVRAGRVGARGGVPGPRQGPGETTALQPRGETATSASGCGDVAPQPRLWQRPRQLSLANGGKRASVGPQDGWKAAGGCRLLSHPPLLALDAPGSGLPLGPALMGEPRSEPRQLARAAGEAGPRGSPPPPRPVPSPSGPLRSAGRRGLCAPLPGAAAAAGLGSPRTRSAERAAMPERDRRQPIGGRRGREPSLRTGQRDEGRRR